MSKLLLKCLIVFISVFLFCVNLTAGELNNFSVKNKLRYIKKSDAKNRAGDFSLSRNEIALYTTYSLFDKVPIDFGVGLRQFNIDDDTGVDLPDTLQSKSVNVGVRLPVPFTQREDLFMGLDLMPQWNSASEHDFADEAFHFNWAASLILRQSEKFITAFGVWFRPGYKNMAVPFWGVRYKPNEKMTFNFLSSEPSFSYRITNKTKVLVQLDFLSSEFEVTDGAKRGEAVRIRDVEAGLGIEYDFNEFIMGALNVGYAFGQQYEYLNAQHKVQPKNSLYIGYRLNVLF